MRRCKIPLCIAIVAAFAAGAAARAGDADALRGTLAETGSEKATTAATLSFAAGATTNAGPQFDKVPGAVFEAGAEIQHVRPTSLGELTLSATLRDRQYPDAPDADELAYRLGASLDATAGGRQTLATLAVQHGTSLDENLTEYSTSWRTVWQRKDWSPFVKISAAYLDYADLVTGFLETGNQDDRDRLSATAEVGLRRTIGEHLALVAGVGIDTKRYTARRDDFGLARDSISGFPFIGATYKAGPLSAELLYAPVLRHYRDPALRDFLAQTVTLRGEMDVARGVKIVGLLRAGIDETDFFTARAALEQAAALGLSFDVTAATKVSLDVTLTRRDHLGIDRLDHKTESTLRTRTRIGEGLYLTSELKYLDFHTTFGGLDTDAASVLIGIARAFKS